MKKLAGMIEMRLLLLKKQQLALSFFFVRKLLLSACRIKGNEEEKKARVTLYVLLYSLSLQQGLIAAICEVTLDAMFCPRHTTSIAKQHMIKCNSLQLKWNRYRTTVQSDKVKRIFTFTQKIIKISKFSNSAKTSSSSSADSFSPSIALISYTRHGKILVTAVVLINLRFVKRKTLDLRICCRDISRGRMEKFEDLKAKGCQLLGPQCVLSCAKENRDLPKQQGFTCCLAMDGVKVLLSGFEKDEKVKLEELVTAMGGIIQNRASMDISFVVVKNVSAAKYKWALTVLKKPIVTISWLYQCWNEHRVVPQEPHRVLPFFGLTICVTRVKADMRKEMEKLVLQNGGKYSADLTKKCDKYKVARKWGHIHIVTSKWLDQSIARRGNARVFLALLHTVVVSEDSTAFLLGSDVSSTSSASIMKGGMTGVPTELHSQVKGNTASQSVQSSMITEVETALSQNMSSAYSDSTVFTKCEDSEAANLQPGDETKFDGFVADDSQTEDDDSYLSDCRILFVGFQASEMRKLVKLVHKGGGSRCMSFSEEKLTHIVVGSPSENEKKQIRHHAALGIIYVVKTTWLVDCDREKKEVPVSQRHVCDLLPPTAVSGCFGKNQGKTWMDASVPPTHQVKEDSAFETGFSFDNGRERKLATNLEAGKCSKESTNFGQQEQLCSQNDGCKDQKKLHPHSATTDGQDKRSSDVFKGLRFRFSSSFPNDRRAEIVEWVNQGGGEILDDHSKQNVHFTIESHGLRHKSADVSRNTMVSSHWIRFCLEGGCVAEISSHIIYSPLCCRVPFPGFEGFRFCVSQYDEKEKMLLRNLCFVLGAKFTDKLQKRVTHLLCKFSSGPKYEAACKWGIQTVTSEWISECIRQDKIVPMDSYRPKDATSQDREAGLCTSSQCPTQAARMTSGDIPSQFPSQSQAMVISSNASSRRSSKRVTLLEVDHPTDLPPKFSKEVPIGKLPSMKDNTSDNVGNVCYALPKYEERVSECIRQDTVLPMDVFVPEDVRAQAQVAGLCTVSQYHTQANRMVSGDVSSQFPSQSQASEKISSTASNGNSSKRIRFTEVDNEIDLLVGKLHKEVPTAKRDSMKNNTSDGGEVLRAVPDVAAAIEDLLAQSNKIQDIATPGRNGSDQSIFSSDCSILGQDHVDSRSVFEISKHWLSRTEKQGHLGNPSGQEIKQGIYDGFSETQTESQVVVYEEDLSGRQRIIERVQTHSSLS
ncbi:Dna topoisomerase 2-binding protein [Thalictrum thalictroides]|uniref:Dna topoisomerase 2-binding protein n=1 Tax=Thalictrum thalictroides TaxID=46969 RepID=A0A7J6XF56_THATH|nr:Dna topoisomerase 2-binding protein [Thalictrum thalictroides]